MSSSTPYTKLYLSETSYLPDKRQIVVKFSNKTTTKCKTYEFYPCFFVSTKDTEIKVFTDILSLYDLKRFTYEFKENNILKIKAATFSDLKKLAKLISSSLGQKILLIDPERQFLIQNNWSYYDTFQEYDSEIFKVETISCPDVSPEFLSTNLTETLSNLLGYKNSIASNLVQKFSVSNILCVPLELLPLNKSQFLELLLEKIFFKHSFPLSSKEKQTNFPVNYNYSRNFSISTTELSFSPVWSTIFTFPFFNLGFDSINCSCCQPENLESNNILPNSLIEVSFLVEGFYFESSLNTYSTRFHSLYPQKDKRIRQQQEWCLPSIPVGPFHRKDSEKIPFSDFKYLSEKNKVELLSHHELKWFCRKNESFLSREFIELNQKLVLIKDFLDKQNTKLFSEEHTCDVNLFYLNCFYNSLSDLIFSLPFHFLLSNSKFYSYDLSETILAIHSNVLDQFKRFSEQKGAKVFQFGKSKTFVDSESTLSLVKEFSSTFNLPQPEIVLKPDLTH